MSRKKVSVKENPVGSLLLVILGLAGAGAIGAAAYVALRKRPKEGTTGAGVPDAKGLAPGTPEEKAEERAEFIQEFVKDYSEDLSERGITTDAFLKKSEAEQNAIIISVMSAAGEKPPDFIVAPPPGSVPAVPQPAAQVKGLQREIGYLNSFFSGAHLVR